MMVLAGALLVLSLAMLVWLVRTDMADYAAFKLLVLTADRQKRFRAWAAKSFLLFAGATVLCLALLGRLGALTRLPAEFAGPAQLMRAALPAASLPGPGFFAGLLGALAASLLIGALAARRGKPDPMTIGDIQPMMPRNWAETAHVALLSLNAGLSEELFFRLLLPLLLALATGQAMAALVGAAIIFGLIHLYQGWLGVVATAVLGLALTSLYLWTGNLWIAVGAHALLDLVSLVVRPTLARLLSRR